ncbi:Z1 domain-containing protein [Mesorhizobium sp. CA6]|uniref:Z1 domain-containing protein n=1 Tax=Mesorhizobium sp. CA6 TaxID=588500 RepID=UPI001CCCCDF9|nr:Z1 domain-containing protein [Mesorhizobium sp. CA6]MBZ9769422.1 Z1 domain-containing protein [Mesorhizobium sp. CA6]
MSNQSVIKFAQELLVNEDPGTISPAMISAKIDQVLAFQPAWREGFDQDAVIAELVRRFSVWVGTDSTIRNDEGHRAWLEASRKSDWRYWQRYREYLEARMSIAAVDGLDRSTDMILGMLEDPLRDGAWDRRGLVVGHVQSGKTGNYTGLICKAADAGYKIIIVLAGLHNNLRSQTQMRLDEGFLGYETRPIADDIREIGVGLVDRDPSIRPNYVTNRTNNGDFSTARANTLGITPEQRPWLFVVKKNKTVLERLLGWVRHHVADAQDENGRKIVKRLPLLLIDDEADHASVDTGEQIFDEDGNPDPEHQPTAINSLTRKIVHTFSRSAYVGYTATPFANIFIHERGETKEEGPDLFPSAFIVNLAAPSSYVGPAQIFGLRSTAGRTPGLPLYREVDDHMSEDGRNGWMPHTHKNGYVPRSDRETGIPATLEAAIDSFLIACAVRRLRGQGDAHSSMLVHVTRFTSVQKIVHQKVEEYILSLRQRLGRKIGHEDAEARLGQLWFSDFVSTCETSAESFGALAGDAALPAWPDVLEAIRLIIADIDVRMINGTAKDALDYADQTGPGLKVIAIGGDKLSRGLTLEGLCVSYFLRTSKMYDTLMQMGRWFGYRPGYIDLCRLYTTAELAGWFGHIADAAEELREEFDLMAGSGATPREYGLKVQSHPVLLVTSRLKMRSAKSLMLSFSGQISETITLFTDKTVLQRNLDAATDLVRRLGGGKDNPERQRGDGLQRWQGRLWEKVAATEVIAFLNSYRTHPDAYKVNSVLLAEFITKMNLVDELTSWTVVVVGGGRGVSHPLAEGFEVAMLKRSSDGVEGRYSIGRLLSPRDEALDLDEDEWKEAMAITRSGWKPDPARSRSAEAPSDPSGPAIRRVRGEGINGQGGHRERGLLLIYLLDPAEAGGNVPADLPPVVAFGISFPASESGTKVEYKVNNVAWMQEYGGAD